MMEESGVGGARTGVILVILIAKLLSRKPKAVEKRRQAHHEPAPKGTIIKHQIGNQSSKLD